MRVDPARLSFEIEARDSNARAGVLETAHGPVSTPAFIPLATRGAVRTLSVDEVAGLGFELILGNTFHLFLSPGGERMTELGGLGRFMGWERAMITDSGGFQVFSLAHGSVADEVKGRRAGAGPSGGVVEIAERGVAFRSYIDGSKRFMGPEESMSMQAALRSDIALVFDECTPYRADRDYTARSTERTHRWLGRCLAWHAEHGPPSQAVFGIVQGGIHEDLRRASADAVGSAAVDGLAIGGTLGRDKEEMGGVLAMTVPLLPVEAPKHLLGIGEPDDLLTGIALGIDVFDCAVPTRLARHGTALAPRPEARFRFDVTRAEFATDVGPLTEGCPCPTCAVHSRAYLHYLAKAEPPTAAHLITLHNLAFLRELVAGAGDAIRDGRFAAYRSAVLGGAPPWAGG